MASDSISSYLNEIGRHRLLTADEEITLARQVQRGLELEKKEEPLTPRERRELRLGKKAKERMIVHNLRLVVNVAKKYTKLLRNGGLAFEDLIQEGTLGLDRAVDLFDPTKGYKFSTYSYWWIRQAITRAIHTHARAIRLPINTHELIGRIQRFTAEFTADEGRAPTYPEIAEAVETSPERVAQVLQCHTTTTCCSLDVISPEGTNSLIDLIANPSGAYGTEPDDFLTAATNRDAIEAALVHLPHNEAHIIRERFFAERTLREIADELGFTRSRAGQLQRTALNKLRYHLHSRNHADPRP